MGKGQVPVAVGEKRHIQIERMGQHGEGIGHVDGFTIFVPMALPEETVLVEIDLVKKKYATAKLLKIEEPSLNRVEAPCPIYEACGGCQTQHLSYEAQLAQKRQQVKDVIERIAKDNPDLVQSVLGMEEPWAYRNKMQLPVGDNLAKPMMGFYARGSHQIIDMQDCLIQMEGNNRLAYICKQLIKETGTVPYDEKTGKGVLRHIVGRIANHMHKDKKEEWMLVLVTATKTLPKVETWVAGIRKVCPNVTAIIQNYNPKQTNVILGQKNTVLWGKETISDSIFDLDFQISPHSFFQVNPKQTEVLYKTALAMADLSSDDIVIDAYCGTGTISLAAARSCKKVIGIEIVEPAILDARKNAERNAITNAEFIVADAAKAMPKLYKEGVRPSVIIMDPVRAGCDEAVLRAGAAMQPKRIVYVSCNPATMARDIAVLRPLGYRLEKVQPVDMFPHTGHVEVVSLLVKERSD